MFALWYEAMLSYEFTTVKVKKKMCLLLYINISRVRVCYLVSLLISTGVAGGILWQARSKTKETMLHSTEGSLPDIHWPNGPISTPITFIRSGWVILEETKRLHLTASCSAVWGEKPWNEFKTIHREALAVKKSRWGEDQSDLIWSCWVFFWDIVTRVTEGQANIRCSYRGMDGVSSKCAKMSPYTELLRQAYCVFLSLKISGSVNQLIPATLKGCADTIYCIPI